MTLPALAPCVLAVALWLTTGGAVAQTAQAPAPAASSAADRAARDADKVFRMILMHADKPRRAARDDRVSPASQAAATSPAPPSAVPTPAATSVSSAPVVSTISAEAAARVALPARTDTDLPVAAVPPAVITAPALPSLQAVPVAAAVRAPPATARLELVTSVEPDFPQRLLRTLGPGSVVVEFEVAADGTVSRAVVARSPHRGLHAAAVAAVSAWRFKPPGATTPGVAELKFE